MGTFKNVLRLAAVTAITTTLSLAAHAAVLQPNQQLPAQQVTEFKNTPTLLLQRYPQAGAKMISYVRDLAGTDPSTLAALIELLTNPDITREQRTAILSGLAQVSRLALRSDPNYANEIQQAVNATNNSDISAAYQAATGDVALGIGGTGGGGGGGSGTGGSTGNTGIAVGGSNSGATTFGGLHYSNTGTSSTSGSVGGTSSGAVSRTR
ncbi:hypothetical protein IP86_02405 [Rhodopseudomonas sp. AAP120]|uniref:hypothetical protein n=1 Tax=Rhodopseudomonas sp. AAP120 TaxID=1523430 RepID=UPI0006B9F566|nr:hypothetical protein [Rhodopseudomonas sp. AAP120]KPG01693.1 hypothetical protein IP86_02405 [Rhodopseudomonas sp. AAP120]